MAKSKSQALKTQCASNLKQSGVAETMYAGNNSNHFPDNSLGEDLSWMSPTFSNFYSGYLLKYAFGTVNNEVQTSDVEFCPTDQWHRLAQAVDDTENPQTDTTSANLVGYFYFPGRTPAMGMDGSITVAALPAG